MGTPKPETRSAARIQIRPTSGLAVVKFTTHAQKLDRNLLRTRWYFGAHGRDENVESVTIGNREIRNPRTEERKLISVPVKMKQENHTDEACSHI